MSAYLSRRQRWIMLAQRKRDAVDCYFPLGLSRSIIVWAACIAATYMAWRMFG